MSKSRHNWKALLKKYPGMWVALKDDMETVIASGTTAGAARLRAMEQGYPDAIVTKVLIENAAFHG